MSEIQKIVSVWDESLVLDVEENEIENETAICLFEFHGGNNQQFRIRKRYGGYVSIELAAGKESADEARVASVSSSSSSSASEADSARNGDQDNMTYFCLDVKGGHAENGAEIVLFKRKKFGRRRRNADNQLWKMNKVNKIDGKYHYMFFSKMNEDYCLDIDCENRKLILWEAHFGENQRFMVENCEEAEE